MPRAEEPCPASAEESVAVSCAVPQADPEGPGIHLLPVRALPGQCSPALQLTLGLWPQDTCDVRGRRLSTRGVAGAGRKPGPRVPAAEPEAQWLADGAIPRIPPCFSFPSPPFRLITVAAVMSRTGCQATAPVNRAQLQSPRPDGCAGPGGAARGAALAARGARRGPSTPARSAVWPPSRPSSRASGSPARAARPGPSDPADTAARRGPRVRASCKALGSPAARWC